MKISIGTPSQKTTDRFLNSLTDQPLTYPEQRATLAWEDKAFQELPNSVVENGYLYQFRRATLGSGASAYRVAKESISRGQCFDLSWVNVYGPELLSEESDFCIAATVAGVWSLHGCRVLYSDESTEGHLTQYSLVLGTLSSHAAVGEERIGVVWNRANDQVDFLIGSFSKPSNWLVTLAAPVFRHLQNRFAVASALRIKSEVDRHQTVGVSETVFA